MSSLSKLSRRGLVQWGFMSAGIPPFSKMLRSTAFAEPQVGGRAEEELYPAKGLPGGGQLEIRLSATIHTSDPDALEVAQRLKPFDLESWITEHTRVAEKNEQLAEKSRSRG